MRRFWLGMFFGVICLEGFRLAIELWGWGAVLVYGFLAWLVFLFFWLLLR
jgi:hypothetical protein